jgi:hypothetical protein
LAGQLWYDQKVDEGSDGYFYTGSIFEDGNTKWAYALWLPRDSSRVYSNYGFRRQMKNNVRPVYGENVTIITRDSYIYSNGEIELYGCVAAAIGVTESKCGFFISKEGNPSSTNHVKALVSTKTNIYGNYSLYANGLEASTTYNYCAYVYADGTYYYGKAKNFTTKAKTTILSVDTDYLMLDSKASSSGSFEITCNTDWHITDVPNWLSISKTSGNGNATITLWANQDYTGAEDRSAESIKITADNKTLIVKVSQKGVGVIFNVTGNPVKLSSGAGATATFRITSNINFTVKSNTEWIEVTPTSGNSNTTITVKAKSANPTSSERSGEISISSALIGNSKVTVLQAGNEQAKLYNEPYTTWGANQSQVKSYMSGYTLASEDSETLIYDGKYLETFTAYDFENQKLTMACVVILMSRTTMAKIAEQLQKNNYVRQNTSSNRYVSSDKKTIVTIDEDNETGAYFIFYKQNEELANLFDEPYLNWGASRSTVRSVVLNRGYELFNESNEASEDYYLMYNGKKKELFSVYEFNSRIELNNVRMFILDSVASINDIRSYLTSSLSYTFMGTNSAKTQYFHLSPDGKSFAIVMFGMESSGGDVNLVLFTSYENVSSSSRGLLRSIAEEELVFNKAFINNLPPVVEKEIDHFQGKMKKKIIEALK